MLFIFRERVIYIVKAYLILACIYLISGSIFSNIYSHGMVFFLLVFIPGFLNAFSIFIANKYLIHKSTFWGYCVVSFILFFIGSILWMIEIMSTLYFLVLVLFSVWIISCYYMIALCKTKWCQSLKSFLLYSFVVVHIYLFITMPMLLYVIYKYHSVMDVTLIFWMVVDIIGYGLMIILIGIIADKICKQKVCFELYLHRVIIALLSALPILVYLYHSINFQNPFSSHAYLQLSIISALPTVCLFVYWVIILWKTNITLNVSTLFALGCMSLFVMSGMMDLFFVHYHLPIRLEDTYFTVAHFHLVMGMCVAMGWLSCLYTYWHDIFIKINNGIFENRFYYVHFFITLAGVYIIFMIMQYIGLTGIPKMYAILNTQINNNNFMTYQLIIRIASGIIACMQIIFIFQIFKQTWISYYKKSK